MRRYLPVLLLLLAVALSGCASVARPETKPPISSAPSQSVVEGGAYTSPEQVASYLHQFKKLPPNFITKQKAEALGWVSSKGNLWEVTNRMSIGGDEFGNREGRLPAASGRKWYECDVNYAGGLRGGERIVYSNDGLIYYTKDHYQSFKRLY